MFEAVERVKDQKFGCSNRNDRDLSLDLFRDVVVLLSLAEGQRSQFRGFKVALKRWNRRLNVIGIVVLILLI